ncbi:MAG: CotH kinase family protein [Microthrixaceae bacterium]|nr:CotH kinase family protein [Microthrixaceae bacterium]
MNRPEPVSSIGSKLRRLRNGVALALTVALVMVPVACSGKGGSGTGSKSSSQTANERSQASPSGEAQAGSIFDPTKVHTISVTVPQEKFEAMIANYESTDQKDWIEATVEIDGTTYERVGLRLKGNSSLRGASQKSAQDLPWLIRLNKFVEGQTHDGFADIVVRSNSSETSLNESVALALLARAGLASQNAAPTRFSVNGSDQVLRLIVELPDDDAWQDSWFDGKGALFKAESTGDWSYRGDDQTSYEDVFDQEGGKKVTDMTPLIEFLKFINESDDETFASDLSKYLDVDSFATYLAMMDLVGNFDDISGPGNNAYLWWDQKSGVFTVVPWDLNLAFGVSPGGGGGRGGAAPGAGGPPGGFPSGGSQGGRTNQGGQRPNGGGFGRSNPLVERFHSTETFEALYQQKLTELRSELFDSGEAQTILDSQSKVLMDQASDLVDEATITSESDRIAESFK